MANELKNALDQLKTDCGTLANVQRVQFGQPLNSLADATATKSVVAIFLTTGGPLNGTYTATSEKHLAIMRFHWLLTPGMEDTVEQSMMTAWDVIMTKFFGADADRNLSDKVTLGLVAGEDGSQRYTCGYTDIGGKWHRIMDIPFEIILDTHAV